MAEDATPCYMIGTAHGVQMCVACAAVLLQQTQTTGHANTFAMVYLPCDSVHACIPQGISTLCCGHNILLLLPGFRSRSLDSSAMLQRQVLQTILSSMTGCKQLTEVLTPPLAALGSAS